MDQSKQKEVETSCSAASGCTNSAHSVLSKLIRPFKYLNYAGGSQSPSFKSSCTSSVVMSSASSIKLHQSLQRKYLPLISTPSSDTVSVPTCFAGPPTILQKHMPFRNLNYAGDSDSNTFLSEETSSVSPYGCEKDVSNCIEELSTGMTQSSVSQSLSPKASQTMATKSDRSEDSIHSIPIPDSVSIPDRSKQHESTSYQHGDDSPEDFRPLEAERTALLSIPSKNSQSVLSTSTAIDEDPLIKNKETIRIIGQNCNGLISDKDNNN